jgi:hypothetical protein
MSNNDGKLSTGELIFVSAIFAGAIVGLFALLRWMFTTKAGMIAAAIAFFVLLFLHLTGALDRPHTTAASTGQAQQSIHSSMPSARPERTPSGYLEQGTTSPDLGYRVDRMQVCATLNGVTSCSPINR